MKNENKNSDPRRTSSVRSAAGTSIVGVPHTIRSLLAPSTVLSARSAAGTSIRMHKEEEEEEGNDRLRPPLKLPPGLGFRRRGIRVFNPLYSHSMILWMILRRVATCMYTHACICVWVGFRLQALGFRL